MSFKVMEKRCDECLFGSDKIVSNRRRSEIINEITRTDGHFICHKATLAGEKIACRGDWDQRGCGQLGRIAERLHAVRFVPEPQFGDNDS
jgi:hypothetical protein